ncbi:DsbA family oxidoreductase [uncultured Chitinophaga sp.]|jgi:Predicted dithiol-disulfide isomerase involved in polyketide biosynthesis|uniref:DsbA family oxidoreductase n=1 Tax=uncultured Chitinophaga sp. TaxID=339340 RepID=UPI00261919F3|nr:DsbA family oxidoreductase [uncultured Chitinophaga sp.]
MKVEIWSDVMCPFCYIGKRKFEKALAQFPGKEHITVEWKSFQLNPELVNNSGQSIHEYLAEHKGWTLSYAKQLNEQVSGMAAAVGLEYNLDKAVVANSFDAHRFVHLAAQHGLGDAAEESLFRAYFTEGKDISDREVLAQLGAGIGLDAEEVRRTLSGNTYAREVQRDIAEAAALGARGVPFFVIDRKYAVSGAQPEEVFLKALQQSYNEQAATDNNGNACSIDGDCA